MDCHSVNLGDGASAIVCGGRKAPRCRCGMRAPLLCDWKISRNPDRTCDRPICTGHAFSPAPGKDLCPEHKRAFDEWRASPRGGAS